MQPVEFSQLPPPILSIRNLAVSIERDGVDRPILKDLSLDIPRGETIALLGESGSGKTLAAAAILRILPAVARIRCGEIRFDNNDLLTLKGETLQHIRGNRIGMIFQEPGTSLNPLMTVGRQIGETLRVHKNLNRKIAREQVIALMDMVGIPDARRRYGHLPHQLSGGMRQRVVIAMALACKPDVLLADEPTSALDATVQAQILDLLSKLIRDLRMSVLLISHDLGIVTALADRVAILFAGRIVEEGSVRDILKRPLHPYTRSMLGMKAASTRMHPPGTVEVSDTSNASTAPESAGCPIAHSCSHALPACLLDFPETTAFGNRSVRCFAAARARGDDEQQR